MLLLLPLLLLTLPLLPLLLLLVLSHWLSNNHILLQPQQRCCSCSPEQNLILLLGRITMQRCLQSTTADCC